MVKINVKHFIDEIKEKEFYHYEGSLTTPPCSEGVKWYVMSDVMWINANDLA